MREDNPLLPRRKAMIERNMNREMAKIQLILCRTKRQLQRCKQRMMAVLKERSLRLSRKKTRIGRIELGFHFLGIHYPGTQTPDNTKVEQAVDRTVIQADIAQYIPLLSGGGRYRNE